MTQKELAAFSKEVQASQCHGQLVILDVVILLGQAANLSLTLRVKDSKTVLDFVTEGLRILVSSGIHKDLA